MSGALYVYGVSPRTLPADPDHGDQSRTVDVWASTLGSGIGGETVRCIVVGDLAALVSAAGGEAISRSRRNMLTHTSVLERAMPHATILPLRFGTVAPDSAALHTCISANRSAFHAALRSIEGRVELGLKASWRKGGVFNDIVERDQALRQMRDRLQTRPAGETYYERIELGRRVEAAVAERRAAETAAIMAELLPLAEREAELRNHDEDMIFNRAFLVKRPVEPAFDEAVARVAERFSERLEFRYVGPVPPFNFVNLQAGWMVSASGGA